MSIQITNEAQAVHNLQIIVFKVGEEEYGMPIDLIKEVVITPPITKVPLAAPYIRGVANIRGSIMAIIDLEKRLGVAADTETAQKSMNYTLVIESGDVKMGILVHEVPNTLSVSTATIDYSPSILQDHLTSSNFVQGIIKIQQRLIILLDIFKIISKEDTQVSTAIIN